MRYGSFWDNAAQYLRYIVFGVLLLVAIFAGLGIRQLRHHGGGGVDDVASTLAAVEQDITKSATEFKVSEQQWLAVSTENIPQHVKGFQYSLSSSGKPGILIVPRYDWAQGTALTTVTDRVERTLQSKGYVKKTASPISITTNTQQTTLTRGDRICMITSDVDASRVLVQCSDQAELATRAAYVKPFVDTYLSQRLDVRIQDVSIGQLTIKSRDGGTIIGRSKTAGYDLAEAVIYRPGAATGILALFYKHGGNWQYVTESNMDERGFSCTTIETDPEASQAFAGKPCYDDTLQRSRNTGSPY